MIFNKTYFYSGSLYNTTDGQEAGISGLVKARTAEKAYGAIVNKLNEGSGFDALQLFRFEKIS